MEQLLKKVHKTRDTRSSPFYCHILENSLLSAVPLKKLGVLLP
jgi:hypothetical protein